MLRVLFRVSYGFSRVPLAFHSRLHFFFRVSFGGFFGMSFGVSFKVSSGLIDGFFRVNVGFRVGFLIRISYHEFFRVSLGFT